MYCPPHTIISVPVQTPVGVMVPVGTFGPDPFVNEEGTHLSDVGSKRPPVLTP